MSIKDKLESLSERPYWHWSAVQDNQEQLFRKFLEKAKPRIAVEIGTHHGISAAIIAEYAERVYTIDVLEYTSVQDRVWAALGVTDKIVRYVVKSTFAKRDLLASIPFDFAFVDGSHLLESVQEDWEHTKRCGNVLFHDYCNPKHAWPDVTFFFDKIVAKVPGAVIETAAPFAYYRRV